jgi:excisionase family DNA binding protein
MQEAYVNTKTTDGSDYLTKLQVAGLLQVTPRTVDLWMADGKLPYLKIGKAVRFVRQDIHDHLNANFRRN